MIRMASTTPPSPLSDEAAATHRSALEMFEAARALITRNYLSGLAQFPVTAFQQSEVALNRASDRNGHFDGACERVARSRLLEFVGRLEREQGSALGDHGVLIQPPLGLADFGLDGSDQQRAVQLQRRHRARCVGFGRGGCRDRADRGERQDEGGDR